MKRASALFFLNDPPEMVYRSTEYAKIEATQKIAGSDSLNVDEDLYDVTMRYLSDLWGFDYERRKI